MSKERVRSDLRRLKNRLLMLLVLYCSTSYSATMSSLMRAWPPCTSILPSEKDVQSCTTWPIRRSTRAGSSENFQVGCRFLSEVFSSIGTRVIRIMDGKIVVTIEFKMSWTTRGPPCPCCTSWSCCPGLGGRTSWSCATPLWWRSACT